MAKKRDAQEMLCHDSTITNEDECYEKIIKIEDSSDEAIIPVIRDIRSPSTAEDDRSEYSDESLKILDSSLRERRNAMTGMSWNIFPNYSQEDSLFADNDTLQSNEYSQPSATISNESSITIISDSDYSGTIISDNDYSGSNASYDNFGGSSSFNNDYSSSTLNSSYSATASYEDSYSGTVSADEFSGNTTEDYSYNRSSLSEYFYDSSEDFYLRHENAEEEMENRQFSCGCYFECVCGDRVNEDDSEIQILESVIGPSFRTEEQLLNRLTGQQRNNLNLANDEDFAILDSFFPQRPFNFMYNLNPERIQNNTRNQNEELGGVPYFTEQIVRGFCTNIQRLYSSRENRVINDVLRRLIVAITDYTYQEVLILRNRIRENFILQGEQSPDIADIVMVIHNVLSWGKVDRNRSKINKKYKPTKYKDLINCKDTSCSICYENFKPSAMCISMQCLHVFHSKCLNRWLKESDCCPFCRVVPNE